MIGLVVMKAEDHRSINMKGNILIILFNKQINQIKSNKSVPIMNKLECRNEIPNHLRFNHEV